MQNPFETGHIKNYLFLYASVVVIMILFFIASTLFIDKKTIQKKNFDTVSDKSVNKVKEKKEELEQKATRKFKLLEKAY